uniref:DUF2642 domain-containing protein n=1 Tax=Niallia sp. XMNu-256 TaxID=3082444 RepID=UPI00403F08A9
MRSLEGRTLNVATKYADVSGILVETKSNYIILRSANNFFYVPITSINSVTYK